MDITLEANWLKGWIPSPNSPFSTRLASEHCSLLTDILGESWIQRHINNKNNHHPFASQWISNGIGAFLDLNALAADIALVKDKPHFTEVIKDYKRKQEAEAARHVIHVAAMFERANNGSILQFFPATDVSAPDCLLSLKGTQIPIEAKILTTSEPSMAFTTYAKNLEKTIKTFLESENDHFGEFAIILKDCSYRPEIEEILDIVRTNFKSREPLALRSHKVNIFYTPLSIEASVYFYSRILIHAPRSDSENTRVLSRGKDASKQLNTFHDKKSPGICCIQIGENQDPRQIFEFFNRRFSSGQMSGISSLLLNNKGTLHNNNESTYIDGITVLHNQKAAHRTPTDLEIKPVGRFVPLLPTTPDKIPCYGFSTCAIRVKDPKSSFKLFIPKIDGLPINLID